jgi:hypothetical protein
MLRAAISRLVQQPALAAVILFLAGVAFTALPSLRYGPPLPALHDEYGYLFLGETFAHGHLTNDPPPGPPEFFDTFHEFITPRYIAKFPPGQGVALALGILLGHPIIGIWLVKGLWAIALAWMLRAVAPPGWAFGGAIAAVIGYGAMSYWGYSFWGGSLLALGGALTFGGALRLWQRFGHSLSAAVWAGIGCGVMALTRPLDGFIFALLPVAMIAWTLWRDRSGVFARVAAFVIPAAIGVAMMLGYNMATTGSALQFAHRRYDQTHVPGLVLFVWEKPAPDPPNQTAFLANYERVFSSNMGANPLTFTQYLANLKEYATAQFLFLFPIWIWPLLVLGLTAAFAARDGPARLALLSLTFIAFPLLSLRFYGFSHYIAAWTAPAWLLIIRGLQTHKTFWNKPSQLCPVWACALVLALWPLIATVTELTRGYPQWLSYPWVYDREKVREDLADHAKQSGHPQIAVIVYAPNHDPHAEWVFNSPDVMAQDVLWIRGLGPTRMPELARLFPNHDEWLVYVKTDGSLDHLTPFAPAGKSSPATTKD